MLNTFREFALAMTCSLIVLAAMLLPGGAL